MDSTTKGKGASALHFYVIDRGSWPPESATNSVYLKIDNWNDYSFITSFNVIAFDQLGQKFELPSVRIGFYGQTTETPTYAKLERQFNQLSDDFFSLGMGIEFYKSLFSEFDDDWRREFLEGLRDVVWDQNILEKAANEEVFRTSHLRSTNLSELKDQYISVLTGQILLTDFDFGFNLPESDKFAGFDLTFKVTANSMPSTNMHALIGRNGVGKTTLLNSMVRAIANTNETDADFYLLNAFGKSEIGENYFSRLVSVAGDLVEVWTTSPHLD